MIYLIDNGHGNNTPGKRSKVWPNKTQLFEYKFNRDVVAKFETLVKLYESRIRKNSVNYVIITPELNDISLGERVKRINKLCAANPANYLSISIHGNAAASESAHGWEVHTSPGKTKSDDYATDICHIADKIFTDTSVHKMRADWSDGDPDWDSNFTMLTGPKCPAILTENLFFTNYNDCQFMLSEAGQYLIALVHLNFILANEGLKQLDANEMYEMLKVPNSVYDEVRQFHKLGLTI